MIYPFRPSRTAPASRTRKARDLGFAIKDVARLWARLFRQRAAERSVTLDQCRVLAYLSRNEGATQVRLAELSETDPMTLVRILDRMEEDGWLERRQDPADRRVHRLFLKPAADPVLTEVLRIAERARREAMAGLSAAERARLLELLERVRVNLTMAMPSPADVTRQSARPPRIGRTPARRAATRSRKASV